MSITAYRVLTQNSSFSLDALVAEAISDGWQPQGGPIAIEGRLSQAVVKGVPDGGGGGTPVDLKVEDITDASAVGKTVMKAPDVAAARTAIGAGTGNGTSNLKVGTGATDAKAGNYTPTTAEVANALKAKAQLAAIAALAPDADLPTAVTAINALLAALKA